MKGIIRVSGLEYKEGFSYTYWNLYVVKEIKKRVKKEIGSTGFTSFNIFFIASPNRYRVDYLLISCTSSSWDHLKKELEWKYVCVDNSVKLNKRKQGLAKVVVDFWTIDELEDELSDFPALIDSCRGLKGSAEFEIRLGDMEEYPFYKPYSHFTVDLWKDNYEKNLETGTLVLQAERRWKRDGGIKVWRKRKAWKPVNGNFTEV